MASTYNEHISWPREGEDLDIVTTCYAHLGFPGAVGSTDCVRVFWDRCPYNQRHLYIGKEGRPTLSYSVVVDHDRRIRSVTVGHPGARNDKTVSQFDKMLQHIRSGKLYADKQFHLYGDDGRPVTWKGYYLLCDGGYHRWRCMQCPNKYPAGQYEHSWSKRLESVRKDVECTFGILKTRFRILKNTIRLQTKELIDNVFFTCCILHNMLVEDDQWTQQDDAFNLGDDMNVPTDDFRWRRLVLGVGDVLHVGGDDIPDAEVEFEDGWLPLRQALISHFACAFMKGEVHWSFKRSSNGQAA